MTKVPWRFDINGRAICGAESKNGEVCRKPPTPNGRCEKHGGGSPGRPVKHGRYSRSLGFLAQHYKAALKDPTALLDLHEPLAVMDAIVKRVAERMASGDTTDVRVAALKLLNEAREMGAKDPQGAAFKMQQLHRVLQEGTGEDASMRELRESVEAFSKRAEEAWRILLARQNSINEQHLVQVLAGFAAIVQAESDGVTAQRILARIHTEVMRGDDATRLPPALLAQPDERKADPSGG
jgi:hypothetical protein